MEQHGKNKDTDKTLIQGQFLESEILQSSGKAIQNKATKLSELYEKSKKDLLNPVVPIETSRISTLDINDPNNIAISNDKNTTPIKSISTQVTNKQKTKKATHKQVLTANQNTKTEFTQKITDYHRPTNNLPHKEEFEHKTELRTKSQYSESHSNNTNQNNDYDNVRVTNNDTNINNSVYRKFFQETQEDSSIYNKIKTLVKDSVTIEKQIEALSDAGKTIERVGTIERKVARTNKRFESIEEDDGTGKSIYGNEIKQQAAKKAKEKSHKAKKFVGRKITNNQYYVKIRKGIIKAFKYLIKKSIIFISTTSIFSLPLILALAICISVLSIFGGGDKSVVQKYETYMTSIQVAYDKEVDDWIEKNPKGIVLGVRGNYGDIDWKVPLSVMQGVYSGLELDTSELIMMKRFYDAGLFEVHEEITDEMEVIDAKGNKKKIEFKYLAISNPGYQDYMKWLEQHYNNINEFKLAKGIPTSEKLTDQEKENIDTLYQSDSFFDAFSTEFQDHTTITGSNASETDYDSPEYNQLNPFTSSGYKGQCTWYAYGRALKVTGKKMPLGNAAMWIQNAKAMGYATGSQPSKNAVVVLAGNNFGHVAFVESWDGTSIMISEGNYNNPCANGQCNAVEYANKHYSQLIHQATYDSLEAFKAAEKNIGLIVIGFIYTE